MLNTATPAVMMMCCVYRCCVHVSWLTVWIYISFMTSKIFLCRCIFVVNNAVYVNIHEVCLSCYHYLSHRPIHTCMHTYIIMYSSIYMHDIVLCVPLYTYEYKLNIHYSGIISVCLVLFYVSCMHADLEKALLCADVTQAVLHNSSWGWREWARRRSRSSSEKCVYVLVPKCVNVIISLILCILLGVKYFFMVESIIQQLSAQFYTYICDNFNGYIMLP